MTVQVRIKKLHPEAILPKRATDGSGGYDLFLVEDVLVSDFVVAKGKTGLAIEIPYGWIGRLVPRSSLSKQGIFITNSPGTVDSDYRGEIQILLRSHFPSLSIRIT